MTKQTIRTRVKSATRVNLSYGATLVNLSKQYVNEISTALLAKVATSDPVLDDDGTEGSSSPQLARPPLIVAGRSGEIAHAAMVLSNTTNIEGSLTFKIIGDFPGIEIFMEPPSIEIPMGESAIIRIMAGINDQLPEGVNYPGAVLLEELNVKVAEFVLQRLPDLRQKKPRRTKPATKAAT